MRGVLNWIARNPFLALMLATIVACVIVGPHAVGAFYGRTGRALISGVVAFVRGVL